MNALKMRALMDRFKAAAEARKNRSEEFYWPNVRNWLSTRKGDQPLPTCPVCREVLDVAGIDPVPTLNDNSTNTDTDNVESSGPCTGSCESKGMAAVLPCGHMMCHYCTGRSRDLEFDEDATCPVCRSKSRAPDSEHHIHYHAPTSVAEAYLDDEEVLAAVPLTIPEGGRMPKRCLACLACSALPSDTGAIPTITTTSLYDKETGPLFNLVPWQTWTTAPPAEEAREFNVHFWRLSEPNGSFLRIRTTDSHCCYYERLATSIMQPRSANLNANYEIAVRYDARIGKYILDFWFQENVFFSETFDRYLDLSKLIVPQLQADVAKGRLSKERSRYLMMTAMHCLDILDAILRREDLMPTMPLLWFSKGVPHYTNFPFQIREKSEDEESEKESEAETEGE
ncbi:hypothetical protein QBC37DRAFT_396786 [Rhypophila decipiens]|uniref:RING-type domain-containing protein n=1 Tax=Rhypophila decipiens TaxID=261697 RepID=A0AAN6YDM0_9PEZI|nr:hypothetical protein QBC37DRAFT_396786 [Rhypophila decipiens]